MKYPWYEYNKRLSAEALTVRGDFLSCRHLRKLLLAVAATAELRPALALAIRGSEHRAVQSTSIVSKLLYSIT